jgi:hypothetical protein
MACTAAMRAAPGRHPRLLRLFARVRRAQLVTAGFCVRRFLAFMRPSPLLRPHRLTRA